MTRSRFLWTSVMVAVAALFVLVRAAHADATSSTDDGQQVVALIDMLMSGKYIPAVGVFLISVVAVARAGLGVWVPWFKTRSGGYVLGFGSAAVLYLGSSMQAGKLSPGIAFAALGAGWAAAGGWEHLGDLTSWLRSRGMG